MKLEGHAQLERYEVGFWVLVKSAAIASVVSQVAGLILLALIQNNASAAERFGAVLALPMTIVFFAVPAFIWTGGIVLVSYYGLRAGGFVWATPFVVGAIGLVWAAWLFITKPDPSGATAGYEQMLALVIAWTLIVWGIYARLRLFGGENNG